MLTVIVRQLVNKKCQLVCVAVQIRVTWSSTLIVRFGWQTLMLTSVIGLFMFVPAMGLLFWSPGIESVFLLQLLWHQPIHCSIQLQYPCTLYTCTQPTHLRQQVTACSSLQLLPCIAPLFNFLMPRVCQVYELLTARFSPCRTEPFKASMRSLMPCLTMYCAHRCIVLIPYHF